jgi:hypothetical protein
MKFAERRTVAFKGTVSSMTQRRSLGKPASKRATPSPISSLPTALHAAIPVRWSEEGLVLSFGAAREVTAKLDSALDRAVVETALRTSERLLIQPEGDGWVVLGALRTRATPGVDELEEVAIKARRLRLEGTDEVQIVSAAASMILRVTGAVETIAKDVTVRATGLHKLIGRVLHLN